MSLRTRLAKLEEKAGMNRGWTKAVRVVSHEHYPPEKLDAFLRKNGVYPDDPEILLINRRIVEWPKGSCKMGMFEPYFPDRGALGARQP